MRNQVVAKAVAEVFLLVIAAHIDERQHGNRGSVGQGELRLLRRRN